MSYSILRYTFKNKVIKDENGKTLEDSRDIDTLWICEYDPTNNIVCGRHIVYIQSKDGKWRIYGVYVDRDSFKRSETLEDAAKRITALSLPRENGEAEPICKFDIYTEDYAVIEKFMEENGVVPYEDYKNENPVVLVKPGKLFQVTAEQTARILNVIPIPVKTQASIVPIRRMYTDNLVFEQKWINRDSLRLWNSFDAGTYTKDLTEWYNEHFFTEYTISYGEYYKATLPKVIENAKEVVYDVETTDSSIRISKCVVEANFDIEQEKLVVDITKTGELFYCISREGNYCKRIGKRTEKEISPLEFFNINSKTVSNPEGCYCFGDSEDADSWFLNNVDFCKRSGFFNYASEASIKSRIITELILYISVIYEYPSVELLVKTGYVKLVEDLFSKLKMANTKENIAFLFKKLDELVDGDATKGSLVLRFPKYIGNYLKQTHASLSTYRFWRDIYELENLSKDNFDKFIGMPERVLLNISVREDSEYDGWEKLGLQNIIKYDGYDLIKTLKYVSKIAFKEGIVVRSALQSLFDTLRMAESLNMDIPCCPDNLLQIHDELSEVIMQKRIVADESILKDTANTCTEAVNKVFNSNAVTLPRNAMKYLTFKFPETKAEFVSEGINQHNCVAGYANMVASGECIIFFVRKIDSPDTSYITAEISRSGMLNQVMYSNNRPVHSFTEDYKYCQHIATIVTDAYKKGEVFGFNEAWERHRKGE